MDTDGVTLRPDRQQAAVWGAVGLVATALAAYAFGSSPWGLFTGVLVFGSAIPTAALGLQLLAPETWTLRVDRDGLEGHVISFPVAEPFAPLRAVELHRWLGEPVLVLLGDGHRRRLLLPIGCDLARLEEVLRDVEHARARGD